MGYRSYDFRCEECDYCFAELIDASQKDEPQFCPNCEEVKAIRTISVPNFMSQKRHMGENEFRSDTARQKLIEAGRIKKEMYDLPPEKRKEHQKAIDKLTRIRPEKESGK